MEQRSRTIPEMLALTDNTKRRTAQVRAHCTGNQNGGLNGAWCLGRTHRTTVRRGYSHGS